MTSSRDVGFLVWSTQTGLGAAARLTALLLLSAAFRAPCVVAQSPELAPSPLVGAYLTDAGDLFLVGEADEEGIRVRDMATGLSGVLEADGPDLYRRGEISTLVERDAMGAITALRVTTPAATRRATRVPMRTEEVSWTADGARLAGTLLLPEGEGPFRLVISQPGSSWTTRYNEYGVFPALMFVASGSAALIYDKRGFGASEGDRLVAFERTARDLAAAVEAMRLRFEFDPTRIGVFGLSQGGWIAPLAATYTDGIRFMALVGAPGTTPARQEIQRARAVLESEGFPPEEVAAIERFQEIAFHYGNTGEGWNDYLAARAAAEGKGWLGKVWSPEEPGPDFWLWGRLNGNYNPLPALLELRVPVLAVWGERDLNVLPEVHRSIFEVALDAAGNRDYTLTVVPAASHTLEIEDPADHSPATLALDLLGGDPFDRAAWEAIVRWVGEQ